MVGVGPCSGSWATPGVLPSRLDPLGAGVGARGGRPVRIGAGNFPEGPLQQESTKYSHTLCYSTHILQIMAGEVNQTNRFACSHRGHAAKGGMRRVLHSSAMPSMQVLFLMPAHAKHAAVSMSHAHRRTHMHLLVDCERRDHVRFGQPTSLRPISHYPLT